MEPGDVIAVRKGDGAKLIVDIVSVPGRFGFSASPHGHIRFEGKDGPTVPIDSILKFGYWTDVSDPKLHPRVADLKF